MQTFHAEKAARIEAGDPVKVEFLFMGKAYDVYGTVLRVDSEDLDRGQPVVIYLPEGGTGESWARLDQVTEVSA